MMYVEARKRLVDWLPRQIISPGVRARGRYPRKPSATRLTISNMIAAAVCAVIRLG